MRQSIKGVMRWFVRYVCQHWVDILIVVGVIWLVDLLASGAEMRNCFGGACREGGVAAYYDNRASARVAVGMIVIGILAFLRRRKNAKNV